ncbi:hypothetical protein QBC46DRAFT_433137 [Diplogelasinospora grovesii]|uniref:Uncharacterized protein n=1 Tax=Diplogelasinospora grovesii TaxID=303347 RepID=A0AAN6N9Z6_9PEZI|nr:hypothetical protein QBC46DRAFT_433137 [Diplogelasinospora grovesii]
MTPDNLLYDPTTGRIIALLDYDFAGIQVLPCIYRQRRPVSFASSGSDSAREDELQKPNVKRPSTIQGIDRVADVDELLGALKP